MSLESRFKKLVITSYKGFNCTCMQVVDKMQSGNKSKRDGWRTELPATGLGSRVIDMMKEEKAKDVAWQGKCSGTVYVCIFNLCCTYNL